MKRCLILLSLLLPAAATAVAAEAPKAAPDYVLGPGDVMDVTVTSHPGYDRSIIIQPDGKIFFPVVGEVTAAGLTVPRLRETLLAGLETQLNRPDLTISLREIRSAVNRVSVLGAVRSPNVMDLQPRWRIMEALAAAGGPAANADLTRVTVTRANQRVITVDLAPAARSGRAENNLELEPGDLIIVPEGARPTVLVLGEVVKPSSYSLELGSKVMDALSLAGGATPNADLHSATIARLGEEGLIRVDLGAVLISGDLDKNVPLQAGDTLYVPPTSRKVYVVGEVGHSGSFPLRGGERLMDALMAAGGPSKEADMAKASLFRRKADGQASVTKVDLKRLLGNGDMKVNHALEDGDVLFVPNRRQKRPITDYLNLLYPLTWLRSLVP
jgi:polysaccharide export outer membrane protein